MSNKKTPKVSFRRIDFCLGLLEEIQKGTEEIIAAYNMMERTGARLGSEDCFDHQALSQIRQLFTAIHNMHYAEEARLKSVRIAEECRRKAAEAEQECLRRAEEKFIELFGEETPTDNSSKTTQSA